ncbi:hypothetical protein NECID01_0435 [Nematocida sp. AWRm77]|nr:hypothetical protein NECID01_0435 [Nematocida sp. AWRm77]
MGHRMIEKEDLVMEIVKTEEIFQEEEEEQIANPDHILGGEEAAQIQEQKEEQKSFSHIEESQESWSCIKDLQEEGAVQSAESVCAEDVYAEDVYAEDEVYLEEMHEAMQEEAQQSALSAEVHQEKQAIENQPISTLGTGQVENLTWVQRQILKMEMEIAKQQEAAKNQWNPNKTYMPDEFAYVSSKGGWVRSKSKPLPKKKKMSLNLFGCIRKAFSRLSLKKR